MVYLTAKPLVCIKHDISNILSLETPKGLKAITFNQDSNTQLLNNSNINQNKPTELKPLIIYNNKNIFIFSLHFICTFQQKLYLCTRNETLVA